MAVDIGTTPAYDIPKDYTSGLADLLKEAKNIYEAKKGAGFQTYTAPRIAGFSPEELAAMGGIAGLVGSGQQYFAPAAGLTAGLAQQYTPATAQQYMSPYQQAVIDVEKREAVRAAQRPMQDIAAAAVKAGGFGGSKQAILEAEAQKNLQQQLGDIQTKGQQAAYETGLRAFESQKDREKTAAAGLTSLGQIAPKQSLAELTALSGIGEAQRGMTQAGLDIQYQDFLKQQQYPYDLLGQYQSTLYGYPYQAYGQEQYTPYQKPSTFQQLAGVLGSVGKVGSAFGFFNTGGKIAYQSEGGLSGMTKKLQAGSSVGSPYLRPFYTVSGMYLKDEQPSYMSEDVDMDQVMTSAPSMTSTMTDVIETQDTGSDDMTVTKKDIVEKYLQSMMLGTNLLEEQKKFREQQEEYAKKKLEKLEREAGPIQYGSDVLLGIAGADPRDPLATQIATGVDYAEGERPDVELARYEIQKALAEGRISEIEAQAALAKTQTSGLIDIYQLTAPTDYLIGLDVTSDLTSLAGNLGFSGKNAVTAVNSAKSQARSIISENPEMYNTAEKQQELVQSILMNMNPNTPNGTPVDTDTSVDNQSPVDAAPEITEDILEAIGAK